MSKLDTEAVEIAYLKANEKQERYVNFIALIKAISAYRQAECKPFKDAPRDGTVIEAYFVKNLWNRPKWRPAWRSDQSGWVTVEYSTLLINDVRCWKEVSSERVFGDGHCFTHYRIPFNPEEG